MVIDRANQVVEATSASNQKEQALESTTTRMNRGLITVTRSYEVSYKCYNIYRSKLYTVITYNY